MTREADGVARGWKRNWRGFGAAATGAFLIGVAALAEDRPTTRSTRQPSTRTAGRATSQAARFEGKNCLASGCHAPLAKRKHLHGPLAVGECEQCHEETDGKNHKYRLTDEAPALCFECHVEIEEALANPTTRPSRHEAVKEGKCLDCHDPHASGHPKMLRTGSTVTLCMTCHKENLSLEGQIHKAVEEKGCLECHRGHDSDHEKLLRGPAEELCIKCHADEYKAFASLAHVHAPVAEKSCVSCHSPHASTHGKLLIEAFTADLYVPYDDGESFGLCFQCHEKELLEEEETDEATGFRNGERNLHYLHVNKETKGRGCRICHLPHGSSQHRLIRPMVRYKDWELKIRFTPTETGGYCGPGCHPAKRYDRSEPIDMSKAPIAPAAVRKQSTTRGAKAPE